MQFRNFGKNVNFSPKYFYEPKTEIDVLEILNKHKNGQIRAIGSGHAWSHAIESQDAFVDLKNLNEIKIISENGKDSVSVGGGCKLEHLLKTISKSGFTIPAMGGIMRQTVAGLASTATHGTGRSSFSHYIEEVRLAAYDSNGNAKIYEFKDGKELLAARTAVGCMGIILSLKIPCLPKYWITEQTKAFKTIDEVLEQEKYWPLQQTVVIPHLWQFFGFQRKIDLEPKNKALFAVRRFFDYLTVEIIPHLFLKTFLIINSQKLILNYYTKFLPKFLIPVTVTNEDYKALTLHTRHHYTFTHVETEIFIPERNIKAAFHAITQVTDWFAGTLEELDLELQDKLKEKNLLDYLVDKKGAYLLHYTPFIRKVMPDDSLIAMTSGNEAYYAIGFFTYHQEKDRSGYYDFAKTLSLLLNKLFEARLHWGKNYPLEHKDIERLYPKMEEFKQICRSVDPNGVFQNEFTKKVFGF
ncbi:MAG TPA: D-arabinono-1,4-lactone oxidase [Candidatus Paceibacterota bacterium]